MIRTVMTLALALGLPAGSALAQDDGGEEIDERARMHFMAGSSYYDEGDYQRAIQEFDKAYDLSERPSLLYNLYLAHERLGHLEEAADHLARYLTEGEPADRRQALERRLTNLHERLEQQGGAEPDDGPIEPPSVEARDDAPGPEPVDETEPEGDATTAVTTSPDEGPSPEPETRGGAPPAAIGSLAVGAAGLALAGTFGILALKEDRSLSDGCSPSCTGGQVSTLRTYDIVADVGLAVGVAAAAAGVILWLLDGGAAERPVALSPSVGPGHAGLAARGSF